MHTAIWNRLCSGRPGSVAEHPQYRIVVTRAAPNNDPQVFELVTRHYDFSAGASPGEQDPPPSKWLGDADRRFASTPEGVEVLGETAFGHEANLAAVHVVAVAGVDISPRGDEGDDGARVVLAATGDALEKGAEILHGWICRRFRIADRAIPDRLQLVVLWKAGQK